MDESARLRFVASNTVVLQNILLNSLGVSRVADFRTRRKPRGLE